MRRILRKIAEGEADKLGDTSTLADPSIIDVSASRFLVPLGIVPARQSNMHVGVMATAFFEVEQQEDSPALSVIICPI